MSLPPSGRHSAPQPQPTPIHPMQPGPIAPAGGQQARPNAQTPPQLRPAEPAVDPRGVKRDREDADVVVVEGSQPPVNKRARTDAVVPSVSFTEDQRALVDAINNGDVDKMRALLARSLALVNTMLPLQNMSANYTVHVPPLFYAAHQGKAAIVDLLVRAGSPVNASYDGLTALRLAAARGHTETIDRLIRHGADVNFTSSVNDRFLRTALGVAIRNRQLEASIYLIQLGAGLEKLVKVGESGEPGKRVNILSTPLLDAIQGGFAELIEWLLNVQRLRPENVLVGIKQSAFHTALERGALSIVKLFVEHGADLNALVKFKDGPQWQNVWHFAVHQNRLDMIEYLLRRGLEPNLDIWMNDYKSSQAGDLLRHLPQLIGATGGAADGLAFSHMRERPELLITTLADNYAGHKFYVRKDFIHYLNLKLSTIFFNKSHAFDNLVKCRDLLSRNPWKPHARASITCLTIMQGANAVSEIISEICGNPETFQPYSGCKLTPEGEAAMDRMVDLQRELLLKGVSTLRTQFADLVSKIPDDSVDKYISLSGKVNERDLYRGLTKVVGLYDPVARAAIRLVKDSYAKLSNLSEGAMTPEFLALPTAGRLKMVMADTLREWDKIREMVDTMRQAEGPEQLDLLSDLLFQQWRQLCAAFGVEKPRWQPFGPHQPENKQTMPQIGVDSGEV